MQIPIDIFIERILAQMQQELQLTEEEKNYWRNEIRKKLEKEGRPVDETGTD